MGYSDHRNYRMEMEHLTALHDEWMHSSTGTSSNPQGMFETLPEDTLQHVRQQITLPPSVTPVGFSQSDIHAFLTKVNTRSRGDTPQNNGVSSPMVTPNTTGGKTGKTTGGIPGSGNQNQGGTGRQWQQRNRGRSGGGGVNAQGPNALGKVPQLGNVPYSTQSPGGTSPTMLILMLGGGILVVYFIWHKLRKSKSEDKEMDKKGE